MDEATKRLWRAVLTDLLVAVNGIHGSCAVCLEHFAERTAPVFERHGIPFRFMTTRSGPMTATAALAEIPVERRDVDQTVFAPPATAGMTGVRVADAPAEIRTSTKRRAETAG